MLTELTAVQRKKALALFPVERDTLIDTIGENIKGEAFGMVPENLQNDKDTAPECVFFWYRYFLYLGGSPESIYADELLEEMKQKLSDPIPLIVPNCEGWESVLRRHFPSVEVRIRAAMRIRKQGLDLKEIDRQLEQFRSPVYTLKKIDEAVFPILMKERWADGLVTNFDSCKEFIEHGFGFVLCTGEGQPVSGCSTYSYYSRGVEIQISTREDTVDRVWQRWWRRQC